MDADQFYVWIYVRESSFPILALANSDSEIEPSI